MLTDMRQISNLRMRKNVAEFRVKLSHFQYATWEMCKGALNNYSMLKLRFFNQHSLLQCIVKTSPISIMQLIRTRNHTFYHRITPKIGVDQCPSFFYLPQLLYYAAFFPLKGQLKYIIIHFPYEISNDIRYCPYCPQLLLMSTDISRYYWTNGT